MKESEGQQRVEAELMEEYLCCCAHVQLTACLYLVCVQCMYVYIACVCVHVIMHGMCSCISENNLKEFLFFLYNVGAED